MVHRTDCSRHCCFFLSYLFRTIVGILNIYNFQKNQKNQTRSLLWRKNPAGLYRTITLVFISLRANNRLLMTEFVCDWCGKCCRSFGEFIKIERKLTDRDYYCRYGITNDLFLVHVQPEYADAVSVTCSEQNPGSENPEKNARSCRKIPGAMGSSARSIPPAPRYAGNSVVTAC